MATYDIVQQTYNVGTETAVVWRKWFAVTLAEAVKVGENDERTILQYINDRFSELMGEDVPETFDTIKEIADYIESHGEVSTALNEAIANKVDKVEGKGLSTNDYTTEDKTALEVAAKSSTLTNATPTPVTHGGIPAGTTFENVSVNKVLNDILYPYVKPNASITVTIAAQGSDNSQRTVLQYNGETGEITNGNILLDANHFKGVETVFDVTVECTVSNKDAAGFTYALLQGGAIVGEATDQTTFTQSVTAGPDLIKLSLQINDGTGTTEFPIAYLKAIDPIFVLNDTEGIAEKTEIAADDIETEIAPGRGISTRISISGYNNRRIVLVCTKPVTVIYDQNNLDVTQLFSKVTNVSVSGKTAGNYTGCVMYVSDPITIESPFNLQVMFK